MKSILKFLAKERRPLKPEPKPETKQTNLKDFNMMRFNNNSGGNVMDKLGIDYIIFGRGDVYDEEE